MDKFVHRANLERFRRLLAQTTDEIRRRQLEKLIAEEGAKEELRPEDGGR